MANKEAHVIDLLSGGYARLANDYRRQGMSTEEAAAFKTCSFVEVTVDGGTRVFVVTIREVIQGEELLLDYGDEYWPAYKLMTGVGLGRAEEDC